jgi:hypothetical protein
MVERDADHRQHMWAAPRSLYPALRVMPGIMFGIE